MPLNLIQKSTSALALAYKRAFLICCLIALSGCASIGTQYVSPLPTQPGATLVSRGGGVFINTHDEKGCYQGRTEIPGEKEARLWPGRETIFVYEIPGSASFLRTSPENSVCRAVVSFVPQEGAHYTITSTGAETETGPNGKQVWHYCGAAVSRQGANGVPEPVAVKKLKLRQRSVACIQAIAR